MFSLSVTWSLVRRHKKKAIACAIVLTLLALGVRRVMLPSQPEYVTAIAVRGDLRQIVEAVGTVVSERELELRFAAVGGIVSQVSVKEGDRVRAGQRLAQLRSADVAANVAVQKAALDSAFADLRAMEEGSRPEDIAVAEADLENKRAALEAARQTVRSAEENLRSAQQQLDVLRQEANVSLVGHVSTSQSTLNEQLTVVENALSTIDDVLSRTDVNDAIVKSRPGAADELRPRQRAAADAIAAARRLTVTATDYSQAIAALAASRSASTVSAAAMDALFSLIGSLQETNSFSASAREAVKESIASQRSTIQAAADVLAASLSSVQNASAGFDSRIASQMTAMTTQEGVRDRARSDILTFEASVRISQAQLHLKRAGTRQADIDAARARVRQGQATLARVQAEYADTLLTAPVSGIVTHVNVRIGEAPPSGAAVTLLGESPYRIETFVAEIDIPKVQRTQSGSIELDAFPGTHFTLRVGDVDPAATDKEGVSKYRVLLDFVHPHAELKIGMTGDAEIVTGMRSNVVHVPRRAVIEDKDGKQIVRVLTDDQDVEERPVTIGIEGESGEVEVLGGVKEGETVVVLIKQ